MTQKEVMKKLFNIISNEDDIREAEELAYQNNIALTEVREGNEIIGIAIEDEVVYF